MKNMKRKKSAQANLTNALLEPSQNYEGTNIVNPTREAIEQARDFVQNNPK